MPLSLLKRKVTMPPGVLPGHTVTLAGEGTEHPNKLAGSVRVVAVQIAHPRFDRRGEYISARQSRGVGSVSVSSNP